MPGRLESAKSFTRPKAHRVPDGHPMRLLVMGDFGASSATQRPPLASRPTIRVDADNFDQVMTRLSPRLSLAGGELDFIELDDFHPDSLYKRLDVFQALHPF